MNVALRGYLYLPLLGALFVCGFWCGKTPRVRFTKPVGVGEMQMGDSEIEGSRERVVTRIGSPSRVGDYQVRIQTLTRSANPMKRSRLIIGIAEGMTSHEIKAALGSLKKAALTRSDAEEVRNHLLAGLARLDFAAAWKMACEGGSDEMEGAVGALISELVESNPSAAKALVEGLPPSGAKNEAWRCFVKEMALSDPKGAFELARKHEVSFGRDLFEQWANRMPVEALAAGQQLTDRRERASAVQAALRVWAENDLPLALAWAESAEGNDTRGGDRDGGFNGTRTWAGFRPELGDDTTGLQRSRGGDRVGE